MPAPAHVVKAKLEKQLKSLDDQEKMRVLRESLGELPGYTSGPYGKLRNWIKEQLSQARTHSQVVHQDSFSVRKEGDVQIALVGPPNSGKSSLLHALSGRNVKVGNYPFTTLKPVAATVKLRGALIQLVEIPGLIEGAASGKGNGKAMLAALRVADAFAYIVPLTESGVPQFKLVQAEVDSAGIDLKTIIVATKVDLPGAQGVLVDLERLCYGQRVTAVSTEAGTGLDELLEALWALSGLISVYPVSGTHGDDCIVLPRGSTIYEFANAIHADLAKQLREARVWGFSARFDGQLVSAEHVLADGDRVELKT